LCQQTHKLPDAYKSDAVNPESNNPVPSSKSPLAESKSSDESNLKVLSVSIIFVLVPVKSGCSLCVATALKLIADITFDIIAVALELKLPNLSTALIK
jgi:hypothetical protein